MLTEVTTTYLEMNHPNEFKPKEGFKDKIEIKEIENTAFLNTMFFCGVGLPWKWHSRLKWTEKDWDTYLKAARSTFCIGFHEKELIGYFELERHSDDSIELKYFGLLPDKVGKGLGSSFLSNAVEHAWSFHPKRIWVHTCSFDAEFAIKNYQSCGFSIYKKDVDHEDLPGKEEFLNLVSNFFRGYIEKYNP